MPASVPLGNAVVCLPKGRFASAYGLSVSGAAYASLCIGCAIAFSRMVHKLLFDKWRSSCLVFVGIPSNADSTLSCAYLLHAFKNAFDSLGRVLFR